MCIHEAYPWTCPPDLIPIQIDTVCLRARSHAGNILTIAASLASSNRDTGPSPVRARVRAAENVNRSGIVSNRASDVLDGEVSDRNAVGGLASWAAVLVVLLDDDAVVGDVGEGDAGVGDVLYAAGGVVDGLDADAVLGVGDGAVGDVDVCDVVVVAATDGADGETWKWC